MPIVTFVGRRAHCGSIDTLVFVQGILLDSFWKFLACTVRKFFSKAGKFYG